MMRKSLLPILIAASLVFFSTLFLTVALTKGIAFQWDIGNFTVGVATLGIAAVSFFVALNSSTQAKDRIQVDIRGLWIEEMRKALAAYIGAVTALRKVTSESERLQLNAELAEREAYLRLKFDLSDPDADPLFLLLDRVKAGLADRDAQLDGLVSEIIQLSRRMFERRWNDEMARLGASPRTS
jgi:hypothetical protein